jgi:hypothetical protein
MHCWRGLFCRKPLGLGDRLGLERERLCSVTFILSDMMTGQFAVAECRADSILQRTFTLVNRAANSLIYLLSPSRSTRALAARAG